MDDTRPDPDALLARMQSGTADGYRGRLRLFLGMCPGVGKTFAMLEAAQERRRAGEEPLVGIAETHNRAETEALLDGLEVLPRREVPHRGMLLRELDLDAALARRPSLLILDELPHTNAPGARHAKRWQDAQEIVSAGTSVYTALNIQHVESLNDAVAQITGVRVRETVPDAFLESADEVVLVDLTPEELLQRLREGKVYLGDQVARSQEGFFRAEKLSALRELALRYVAERVGEKVLAGRGLSGTKGIWPTRDRLLVGVGPSPASARLIRATKRLAGVLQCPWRAVSVETPDTDRLPVGERSRVADHLRMAEDLGAEVGTVQGASVAEALLAEARTANITRIVVGKPVRSRFREALTPSLVEQLIRQSGDIDVFVIRGEDGPTPGGLALEPPTVTSWRPYGLAVASVASASAVAAALDGAGRWFTPHDLALVYVVAVAVASLGRSRRAAILACALAVMSYNFLFVPPRYTFAVASPQSLITFALMAAVSLLLSTLSIRLREQRDMAHRSARRAEDLRSFTELLSVAADETEIAAALVAQVRRSTGCEAYVYPASQDVAAAASPVPDDPKEAAVARWVMEHRRPAGRGTQTLASARLHHLPLAAGERCYGAMAVDLPPGQQALLPEQRLMLDALVRQAVLAFLVKCLDVERRGAVIEAEQERLRSSILSAVSHDLRTPLASIIGTASGLVESPESYSSETRQVLLAGVLEEAERLNRLFSNLLEITRLESGPPLLRRQPLSVADVLSAGLQPLRRRLGERRVDILLPPDLPFVLADEILIQQVLWNLFDNAIKFSPPDSPVSVSASVQDDMVTVEIADCGPGLAESELRVVFDKFRRGSAAGATRGVGMGLAISKSIVEAHGGSLQAANAPAGGAIFRFTLPVAHVDLPEEEGE